MGQIDVFGMILFKKIFNFIDTCYVWVLLIGLTRGSKRVSQCFTERGSWRPNKDCNILTPLLWPSALCLSCSPDAQQEPQGLSFLLSAGFLYHILSPTGLQNYWGPRGPLRPGVAFPTTSYQRLLWTPTV